MIILGLLCILECSGIYGNLRRLISNFLSNREQRVLLNGESSEWKRISVGVPQGSVLGPLFFHVYINDIVENIHSEIKLLPMILHFFPLLRAKLELLMISIESWRKFVCEHGNVKYTNIWYDP